MEKNSWRRILAACLSLLMFVVLGVALAACKEEESKAEPGPETGMYYYDADDGDTYYITLSDADRVSPTYARYLESSLRRTFKIRYAPMRVKLRSSHKKDR